MANDATNGNEFQVNTSTGWEQDSTVTGLEDGGFIVTWKSTYENYDGKHITFIDTINSQRYNADGTKAGGEFIAETGTGDNNGTPSSPAVTKLSTGGYVMTWSQGGLLQDVCCQLYNASGNKIGSKFTANTYTTGMQGGQAVAELEGGGFVVTWSSQDQDGSTFGIYGQRFDNSGNRVGNEFRANTYTTNEQNFSSVTGLTDGGFVVTWNSTDQDGDSYGIYGQRYSASGNRVGSEIQINTYTTGQQSISDVTALSNGGFVVEWCSWDYGSLGQDGDRGGIFGQRFDTAGNKLGSEFMINTWTTDEQQPGSITSLKEGCFVVTWYSNLQNNDSTYDVYGQLYDGDGNKQGNEFIINTSTYASQVHPSVAGLSDGGFVVTWEGTGYDPVTAPQEILCRRFNEDGTPYIGPNILGNAQDNILNGYASNNVLMGYAGNDVLNGGAGGDVMYGGTGNDSYYVDAVGDVITEAANAGIDTVYSNISHVLGTNFEKLVLIGASAINGYGNSLDNTLSGNVAANILNGSLGADTMIGGLGNDTYYVDNAGDVILETSALQTEIDTVVSSISRTLGNNIEKLILTGASAINGAGNALNNTLLGNVAANTLNGGLGADTMIGGLGNDTYYVDNASDITYESSALLTEIDTVVSSVTRSLVANIERLYLSGTAAINGFGNTLANTLVGNAAANLLNGGLGADTMIGGSGNDTYYVDNASDITYESSALLTEIDTVVSSVTRSLVANIERLYLSGTAAINGFGNALANTLVGNTAANLLDGGLGNDILNGAAGNDILAGGMGNDTLVGGVGQDSFLFNTALNSTTNRDVITDYSLTDDTIRLENAVFSKLTTTGLLSSSNFRASDGGSAADANDFILYNTTNGALFYDADGIGAGAAVQFASLNTKPVLTSGEFLVV